MKITLTKTHIVETGIDRRVFMAGEVEVADENIAERLMELEGLTPEEGALKEATTVDKNDKNDKNEKSKK
jgi:hypothetical protein